MGAPSSIQARRASKCAPSGPTARRRRAAASAREAWAREGYRVGEEEGCAKRRPTCGASLPPGGGA